MTIPCNQRPRQGELGFDAATKADLPTSKFDTLNPKFDRLVLFSFPAVSRGDWLWVKLLWRSKLWDPTKTGPKKQYRLWGVPAQADPSRFKDLTKIYVSSSTQYTAAHESSGSMFRLNRWCQGEIGGTHHG